jgi:hypothetical protein
MVHQADRLPVALPCPPAMQLAGCPSAAPLGREARDTLPRGGGSPSSPSGVRRSGDIRSVSPEIKPSSRCLELSDLELRIRARYAYQTANDPGPPPDHAEHPARQPFAREEGHAAVADGADARAASVSRARSRSHRSSMMRSPRGRGGLERFLRRKLLGTSRLRGAVLKRMSCSGIRLSLEDVPSALRDPRKPASVAKLMRLRARLQLLTGQCKPA